MILDWFCEECKTSGSAVAFKLDEGPHRVTLRNVTILAENGGHRGLALHGSDLVVATVCTITGFTEKGRDEAAAAFASELGMVLETAADAIRRSGLADGKPIQAVA